MTYDVVMFRNLTRRGYDGMEYGAEVSCLTY